ncbi:hypothetical protein NOF04DRAFT_1185387 [Fusarium oxysporum II5]|uniref:Uncharacterized protein n=2 Tax=Fusarium oxysporum species complex TaxID=171631 RepID=X0J3L9_FUSO5|nr:uncharacterized protein FOIG_15880 [Fusarium odoratissimum NRRL 54006]EXL90870.1 hypothetical protein FOIG_15880 [Fusarium odoratissimum NRRL 54006]KAK2128435.1 hypothetical protein NOF04DRAFT_1185387 [Fusarium oxysporum II5]TXC05454.1 hypothetical protein FocTR4_00010279 [Fusarium oxysporum f. sp. cubense]
MQFKYSNSSLDRQLTAAADDDLEPGSISEKALSYSVDPQNKTVYGIFQIFAHNKSDVNEKTTYILVPAPDGRMGYLVVSIANHSIEQILVLRKICADLKNLCYSMSAEDWNSLTYEGQQIRIMSILPSSPIRQKVLCDKNKWCHSIERPPDNVFNEGLSWQAPKSVLDNAFHGLHDTRRESLRTANPSSKTMTVARKIKASTYLRLGI